MKRLGTTEAGEIVELTASEIEMLDVIKGAALRLAGAPPDADTVHVLDHSGREIARAAQPAAPAPAAGARLCAACSRPFQGRTSSKYCSPECRAGVKAKQRKAVNAQYRADHPRAAGKPPKKCVVCGGEFHPISSAKTCGLACRAVRDAEQAKHYPSRKRKGGRVADVPSAPQKPANRLALLKAVDARVKARIAEKDPLDKAADTYARTQAEEA